MNTRFSILAFLLTFFAISAGFYAYIGICDTGGSMYIPFLGNYLSIANWYTAILNNAASGLLNLFGTGYFALYPDKIHFAGTGGVAIGYSCMGIGVIACWVAFVLAHKISWKIKLKWGLLRVISLVGINIVRVALIAWANHVHWVGVLDIDHRTVFNTVSYGLIVLMAWRFIKAIVKEKERDPVPQADVL